MSTEALESKLSICGRGGWINVIGGSKGSGWQPQPVSGSGTLPKIGVVVGAGVGVSVGVGVGAGVGVSVGVVVGVGVGAGVSVGVGASVGVGVSVGVGRRTDTVATPRLVMPRLSVAL